MKKTTKPTLDKKLIAAALLIVLGEGLHWATELFAGEGNSEFSDFASGLLLGLAVGMKVVGIVLLVVRIVRGSGKAEGAEDQSSGTGRPE